MPRLLNPRATSELRRSSAAGLNVVSQRPPLPPKIELRSHSYDGLLDDSASMQRRKATVESAAAKATPATEGNDRVDGRDTISPAHQEEAVKEPQISRKVATGTEASIKSKNRRSRSMDDLFDDGENGTGGECNFLDNTQSMETLLEPGSPTSTTGECPPETPPVRSMGGNICLNRRFVREDTNDPQRDGMDDSPGSHATSHEQLCEKETITVDSTPRFQEDDGDVPESETQKKRDDDGEDDIQSTHSSVTSSLGSTASGEKGGPKKAPKPLINRYVKKVKSFMKM